MTFKPFKHPLFDKLNTKRFILASTSPRRIEILEQMGFKNVEVIPSNFEENLKKEDYEPKEYVRHTAIGKAQAVYDDLKSKNEHENTVILAADTVVELMGEIYEKPINKEHQLKNLKHYRDCAQPQHVLTAVVLLVDGEMDTMVEQTSIYFDETLSDEFLQSYVDTEEGLGVAAGYRVQLRGALMMKKIDGDYFNCVGLPFHSTFKLMEKNIL